VLSGEAANIYFIVVYGLTLPRLETFLKTCNLNGSLKNKNTDNDVQ
jgi:hypothetical protein